MRDLRHAAREVEHGRDVAEELGAPLELDAARALLGDLGVARLAGVEHPREKAEHAHEDDEQRVHDRRGEERRQLLRSLDLE